MSFSPSSRGRLSDRDLDRFPGGTLFDRVARAVCHAGCLPRKELYEAWEVARRSRRLFRGGRVVDMCGGHGLLAHVMLLLDDASAAALVIDPQIPPSASALHEALAAEWKGKITVNAVLPSTIDTPANRASMPKADFAKWVTPTELADVILFLASDAASGVTGALLPVAGRV